MSHDTNLFSVNGNNGNYTSNIDDNNNMTIMKQLEECLCSSNNDTTTTTTYVNATVNYNTLESIRPVGYTLASIVLVSSAGFAIWVYWHKNFPVVQASQPLFLCLVCFGCMIMASAIFPLSVDESLYYEDFTLTTSASPHEQREEYSNDREEYVATHCPGCDVACMAGPWLFFTGFTILFASIFSKIWRVNQLVNAAETLSRVKVRARHAMIPFAILLATNLLLLTLWTILDPLQWKRIYVDPFYSYGTCVPSAHGIPAMVILGLLGAVNLSALILAQIQAYMARNIKADKFSESKYVAIVTASMLQMFVLAIPLAFLVRSNPSAHFFLYCGFIFVICMATLLLIFVPKTQLILDETFDDASSIASSFTRKNNNNNNNKSSSRLGGGGAPSGELLHQTGSSMIASSSILNGSKPEVIDDSMAFGDKDVGSLSDDDQDFAMQAEDQEFLEIMEEQTEKLLAMQKERDELLSYKRKYDALRNILQEEIPNQELLSEIDQMI